MDSSRRPVWTRRALLSSLAASRLRAEIDKRKIFPSEWRRYSDPITEFEVYRLTDPAHASHLLAYHNRSLSRRGGFLIYSSERTGSEQVYRMDLKSGESRQLTDVPALDPASVSLMADERAICFFDGPSLHLLNLGSLKDREIYRAPDGIERCPGASVTGDGVSALFAERRGQSWRLLLAGFAKGQVSTLAEAPFPIADMQARPKRAQACYRQGDEALWLVNFDGKQNRRLKTAQGTLGPAVWSPDGKTILYLNVPEDRTRLNAIREHTPDENSDKLVSPTSQFVHFGANGDASVFAGASANRNSPYILLLVRAVRRELTVCEHRAADPRLVAPVFSPDSQRVYFQSDRHGKSAIYRLQVEKFVEKTDSESEP